MKIYNAEKYFDLGYLINNQGIIGGVCVIGKENLKHYFYNVRGVNDEEMKKINEWVKEGNSFFDTPYHEFGFRGDYIDYLKLISNPTKDQDFFDQSAKESVSCLEDIPF